MYRTRRMNSGEAQLEQLLMQVDAALREEGDVVESVETRWEAWVRLLDKLREWLLGIVPEWWALPACLFRRLLLWTADLIVGDGARPLAALGHAAQHLRLPPPPPRAAEPPRRFRRPLARARAARPLPIRPYRARSPLAPRFPVAARRWVRSPVRRFGRAPPRRFRR